MSQESQTILNENKLPEDVTLEVIMRIGEY